MNDKSKMSSKDSGSNTLDAPASIEHENGNPFGASLSQSFTAPRAGGYEYSSGDPDEGWDDFLATKNSTIKRQSKLEANTPPAPPGMTQRWISVETRAGESLNETGGGNRFNAAYNKGWRVRDPETVPEGFFFERKNIPGLSGGAIFWQGNILCMKSTRRLEAERELREGQITSLDEDHDFKSVGGLKTQIENESKVITGANRGFA